MKFNNEIEKYVAELAVEQYREKQKENKRIKELLSTKKYKYGDYVIKKGTSYFDNVFGTGEGSIGKIVWFDEENDYYRVKYDKSLVWTGTSEDSIELYKGEVPKYLTDFDIEDSTYIQFTVRR